MVLLKKIKKISYKKYVRNLKSQNSVSLAKISENDAVKTFKKVGQSKSFKTYLKDANVDLATISSIKDFKEKVPIVNKEIVFHDNENLYLKENLRDCKNVLLSSGSTGKFSFGLASEKDLNRSRQVLELFLDYYFHILDKKTLIINCLQAVKIPNIDACVIEIGPRIDSFVYVLKTLVDKFEQVIIIGDNYFVKNALEEAIAKEIDVKNNIVHLVMGGVYLSENMRNYFAFLLNIDIDNPSKGLILSSMGISEFGLNLFFESQETINLRRLLLKDKVLRSKIIKNDYPGFLPMFFNYLPQSFFIEDVNKNIVITDLSSSLNFPLIRYDTQDVGTLIDYLELKKVLLNYESSHYLPVFKSPLALIYGKDEFVEYKEKRIYPQQILDGIYSNFDLAAKTTGYFRLSKKHSDVHLEIQLKEGVVIGSELVKQYQDSILKFIDVDIPVNLYFYREFPYGMALDYERKFKFV